MEWAQQHFLRVIIQALLKAYQQEFFVTRTVDDLLWGYKDEILSLIHTFRPSISPYFGLYYGVSGFFFSEPLCLAEEVGGGTLQSRLYLHFASLLGEDQNCQEF